MNVSAGSVYFCFDFGQRKQGILMTESLKWHFRGGHNINLMSF